MNDRRRKRNGSTGCGESMYMLNLVHLYVCARSGGFWVKQAAISGIHFDIDQGLKLSVASPQWWSKENRVLSFTRRKKLVCWLAVGRTSVPMPATSRARRHCCRSPKAHRSQPSPPTPSHRVRVTTSALYLLSLVNRRAWAMSPDSGCPG